MSRHFYTLDEAASLIPRLTDILSRCIQLKQLLRARAEALSSAGYEVTEALLQGRGEERQGTEPLLAEARAFYAAILGGAGEIEALGGELKGPDLVDFWSFEDGSREVMLCWKLGEKAIAWFHTPEAGFAGRQSVLGKRFTRTRGS